MIRLGEHRREDGTLVLHDWGSALGFDWVSQHRDRVRGIAFMEAIVTRQTWPEFPSDVRELFQGFRSPEGELLVLEQNIFVEGVLPWAIQRLQEDSPDEIGNAIAQFVRRLRSA